MAATGAVVIVVWSEPRCNTGNLFLHVWMVDEGWGELKRVVLFLFFLLKHLNYSPDSDSYRGSYFQ